MPPILKSYVGIGVPGPRGPAGPPGGADLGFDTKEELEARVVELVVENAPEPEALEQVVTDVAALSTTVSTLNTTTVKTINGQTPNAQGAVTIPVGGGIVNAPSTTSIALTEARETVYDPLMITGPTTITITGSAKGATALMEVTANGTNVPTITGASQWGTSFGFQNTNGTVNLLAVWLYGASPRYGWSQPFVDAAPAPAPAAAPGAPTALTAGTPTQTSVPLTWTAPATGGTPTDYIVQFSPAGAATWSTFADGTSTTTSATVTGLTAGTAYDFRVAATNTGGTSSYATFSNVSTAAAAPAPTPSAPAAPTALTAGTPTQTTVPLSWTAPASGGTPTDYIVERSAAGANSWTVFADGTSTATSTTVTGLTAGTAYDFRVAATNAGGTSAYATLSNVSTASGAGGDADFNAWMTAVAANSGTVSSSTQAAVNTFISSAKSSGYWSKFRRLNLVCGDYNASIVPVVALAGTSVEAPSAMTSADYAENTGWVTNGTSKYVNTNVIPTDEIGGLSVYLRTTQASDTSARVAIGGSGAADIYRIAGNRDAAGASAAGAVTGVWGGTTGGVSTTGGFVAAHWQVARRGPTDAELYKNGVSVATQTASVTPGDATVPVVIFGLRTVTPSTTAYLAAGSAVSAYGVDTGMTDAEAAAFNTHMQTFQTALGRAV